MSSEAVTYTESNSEEIAKVLVGRRIVEAEMGIFDHPRSRWNKAEGRLVLDDGTELYLTGNDGGCACSAGCYPLEKVATVDNVITSARVEAHPAGDDSDSYEDGTYRIFVFADNQEINVAEFVGSDGNGYYGTGFELTVVRSTEERS
jgi:hypothetical protein